MKKILICGPRDTPPSQFEHMLKVVLDLYDPSTGYEKPIQIINGGAAGADALATKVAVTLNIPYLIVPAQWEKGAGAGPERNQKMIDMKPDLVLAWFCPAVGLTSGTGDTVRRADKARIPIKLIAFHRKESDVKD